MSSSTLDDVFLPEFPPLSRCLLIDSSHRSQQDVLKSLKASNLFEDVLQAGSIPDAKNKLSSLLFDACFLGPSISQALALSFHNDALSGTLSDDCAFILIRKSLGDVKKNSEDNLTFSTYHSIIHTPCSKREFFEGTVRGVLTANKNTTWPGVKIGDDDIVYILESGNWTPILKEEAKYQGGLSIDFSLSPEPHCIELFCEKVQKTHPDKLSLILKKLLSESASEANNDFPLFFIQAIKEWKEELEFSTLKEASSNLKHRLLSYLPSK